MKTIKIKSGGICERCGILAKNRFTEWSSSCTVGMPTKKLGEKKAPGHQWNRNPVTYELPTN